MYPQFEQRILALEGDILDPNFGLSPSDEARLIETCHIVFHSAATVRFHEPLRFVQIALPRFIERLAVSFRLAIQMNVASVKKLLVLCHKMTKLQVRVERVSNCSIDRSILSLSFAVGRARFDSLRELQSNGCGRNDLPTTDSTVEIARCERMDGR